MRTTRHPSVSLPCCICGVHNCQESTDHSYLTSEDVLNIIESHKNKNDELDCLKTQVSAFYQDLRQKVLEILLLDEKSLQEHLNKFYFSHLNPDTINLQEVCELAQGIKVGLPSRKLIRTLRQLKRQRDCNELQKQLNVGFSELNDDVHNYIEEFSSQSFLQKFKDHLPYSCIVEKALPELKIRKSISEISNPQEVDEDAIKSYTWKNVTLKVNSKVLELSNKNITDKDLIREMPVLSSFKGVKDFEIRNNRITTFSCKLIASNMLHLKSVDIRGNRVGDEGVIYLVKGLPHLKSLMISETGCTNRSARAVIDNMTDLEMFWCEQNRVDGPHAIEIANMPKLRVLSFAGNGIDSEHAEKLKKIFNPKGYVVV